LTWIWTRIYDLYGQIQEDALKEWQKLDKAIQQQFAKKLKKCCDEPYPLSKAERDKGLL
jgi:mRNA-degrading endonuclease RelE of RelBE toxin-antitoxin system